MIYRSLLPRIIESIYYDLQLYTLRIFGGTLGISGSQPTAFIACMRIYGVYHRSAGLPTNIISDLRGFVDQTTDLWVYIYGFTDLATRLDLKVMNGFADLTTKLRF